LGVVLLAIIFVGFIYVARFMGLRLCFFICNFLPDGICEIIYNNDLEQ
jgi:hypothetical protein